MTRQKGQIPVHNLTKSQRADLCAWARQGLLSKPGAFSCHVWMLMSLPATAWHLLMSQIYLLLYYIRLCKCLTEIPLRRDTRARVYFRTSGRTPQRRCWVQQLSERSWGPWKVCAVSSMATSLSALWEAVRREKSKRETGYMNNGPVSSPFHTDKHNANNTQIQRSACSFHTDRHWLLQYGKCFLCYLWLIDIC